jgi:hypothetical protein
VKRTILYYPTIDIPTKKWLRHSLLYWDEVSSIVPSSWDDKTLNKQSSDIHYLIDEGQYRAKKPEDLFQNSENVEVTKQLQEEFLEIILDEEFANFLGKHYKLNFKIHNAKGIGGMFDNITKFHKFKSGSIPDKAKMLLTDQTWKGLNKRLEWLVI